MVYLMGLVIRNLEGKFRVYKNKKSIDNHQIINAFYQSG